MWNGYRRQAGKRSSAPDAHKFLEGTSFVVDCFTHGAIEGITGYFLSHFHADHYSGLGKTFRGTPIFCSHITARLCQLQLRVPAILLHPLALDTWVCVTDILDANEEKCSDSQDWTDVILRPRVSVLLLDANHCPGAVMFLFKIEDLSNGTTKHILHTGDFRACSELIVGSCHLSAFLKETGTASLDIVYLDTTYGSSPSYSFPPQKRTISHLVQEISRIVVKENRGRLVPLSYLIVVGTYTIGKERVAVELATLLSTKIWACSDRKRAVLEIVLAENMLGDDPLRSQVHVVPMSDISEEALSNMLDKYRPHYTHIIAIKPTGWTFKSRTGACVSVSMKKGTHPRHKNRIMVLEVPYSEHSSFEELRMFLASFRISRVIPTVPLFRSKDDVDESIAVYFPRHHICWSENTLADEQLQSIPPDSS